jgi:hypothetical protein
MIALLFARCDMPHLGLRSRVCVVFVLLIIISMVVDWKVMEQGTIGLSGVHTKSIPQPFKDSNRSTRFPSVEVMEQGTIGLSGVHTMPIHQPFKDSNRSARFPSVEVMEEQGTIGLSGVHTMPIPQPFKDSNRSTRFPSVEVMEQGTIGLSGVHTMPTHQPFKDSNRSTRFPSVEERVRLYMAQWYAPPCTDKQRVHYTYSFDAVQGLELIFSYNMSTIKINTTKQKKMVKIWSSVRNQELHYVSHLPNGRTPDNIKKTRRYSRDVDDTLWPTLRRISDWSFDQKKTKKDLLTIPIPPVLIQFGDELFSHRLGPVNVPTVMKTRLSFSREQVTSMTAAVCRKETPPMFVNEENKMQSILWKLNRERHYGMLGDVDKSDTEWTAKQNKTVFRGMLTGQRAYKKGASDLEKCLSLPRCRLVYKYHQSKVVDARLSGMLFEILGVPAVIDGKTLTSEEISMSGMLQYKGLLILEGNDVATGLKWAMLSKSVVLMPKPTRTSWAMEELLEPWVHYIPIDKDLTDIEEKTQWILNNDAAARRISERATLWIEDLFFHSDSQREEDLIQEKIMRRYHAHFDETAM